MMFRKLSRWLFLALSFGYLSAEQAKAVMLVPTNLSLAQASPNNHQAWDGLLRKYVHSSGFVDYQGFQKDKAALDAYVQALAQNPPQAAWSKAEVMAYWINLYNAFTIQIVLEHYPKIKSIRDLDGGKVWTSRYLKLSNGRQVHLDDMEKTELLAKYKDPRVHFAVNCASASCPPLLNQAFKAETLEAQLEQATRNFINDTRYNRMEKGRFKISQIFQWYAADFGGTGALRSYLNRYLHFPLSSLISLDYIPYDWSLNKR